MPSKIIRIERQSIKGEDRITLKFTYNVRTIEQVRTLENVSYEASARIWHIPFTLTSLRAFLSLGISYHVVNRNDAALIALGKLVRSKESVNSGTTSSRKKGDHTGITSNINVSSSTPIPAPPRAEDISSQTDRCKIHWTSKGFAIAISYSSSVVAFLKRLEGCFWHDKSKCWYARSTLANLQALQNQFQCWQESQIEQLTELIKQQSPFGTLTLYQSPEFPGSIIVKLQGQALDVHYLKSVSDRCYDKVHRRWILPNDRSIIERLKIHYAAKGMKIVDRLAGDASMYQKDDRTWDEHRRHLINKFTKQHHCELVKYTDCLIRMRYSWNTVRSYTGAFYKYLDYLHPKSPTDANADVANQYLAKLASHRISESLMHRTASAIKFYYDKVVFVPDFALERVQRPKKGRYLPTILSLGEIDRMLRSVSNLKHVTVLYALYGGGMRLNELLSLKIEDIHWDRNQVLIQGGKGKKDRMVMLPQILKEVLVLYFNEYQPIYWLFEGSDRMKPYSPKSVQNIVRKAARAAGITRRVTTHTLRHCFATHLLDRGTDVRFIQELLGHKDIRTTLVYTHVTTNQVTGITSPLDAMRKSDFGKRGIGDTR